MASEQPPTSVGLFAVADEPALPPTEPPAKKRRGSGRKKDPVWDFTTVFDDKRVVCNRCGALIHRYGVAKVERVRNHFERRCSGGHELLAPRVQAAVASTVETENCGATLANVAPIENKPHKTPSYGNKNGVFKRKFACWLYATGQSFEAVENDMLLGALRALKSDAALPTKHELEKELLEMEFAASRSKVSKALSGKKCCLTVENWEDAGGCGVTTFGAVCDGEAYFLESNATQAREEVALNDVEAVLAKEKKVQFVGIVTPSTSALTKHSREKIMKKYPRCTFFYGCVCNALRLLLNDVTSVLPWLEKVQVSIAELADVFHGNHKLQSQLSTDENSPSVEFPDSSSVCFTLDAVLKHEKELYRIVARRDFVDASTPAKQEKLRRVQDFVLGESFVQDLINSLAILRPLQQQLKHFQEDRPPLSQVFPSYLDLLAVYSSMEWVSKKEKALITSCVTERFDAIYGDSHGVAYVLDPLYLGEGLDERKKQKVENLIVRFYEQEGHSVDILGELEEYKAMVIEVKDSNQAYWQLLQSGAVSPNDFWVERRQFQHLQQLAYTVFALPASSSCPSPSFAEQGFTVHSRFYNKLTPEQLQKLTNIYCNSRRGESEVVTPTIPNFCKSVGF
ncbi:unnamed protein product [Phytophthora lilii]|uniref:Unnamed protein product n=1 Tax=Phytophthora lilii TaxID=2077276 RepID=A0A9W6TZG1_9STRA|nr:unnamed protein product [Phytophthora lilii]